MSWFGKKNTTSSPYVKVISVGHSKDKDGEIRVLAEDHHEFVRGRNVVVLNKKTDKTLGYGKVAGVGKQGVVIDIVPIGSGLIKPNFRTTPINSRRFSLVSPKKIHTNEHKRRNLAEELVVQSIDH